jgi:hypothetical protein
MLARTFFEGWCSCMAGGTPTESTKTQHFLAIGDKPGRVMVDKADKQKIPLITYKSLLSLIEGKMTVPELRYKPRPDILAFS